MPTHKSIFRTKHKEKGTTVYAKRNADGTFLDIENIGRATHDDMRTKAKKIVKPGFGFKGDLKRRKK